MQDDLLDIWGDPAVTGKPFATDLLQRKMSLPVIHALAHASLADREQFEVVYRQAEVTRADLQNLLDILDRTGSWAYVEQLAEAEYTRAMTALNQVVPVDHEALEDLRSLARSLLRRVH